MILEKKIVFQKQGNSSNSPDTIFLGKLRKKKSKKNHLQTFKTNVHTSANQTKQTLSKPPTKLEQLVFTELRWNQLVFIKSSTQVIGKTTPKQQTPKRFSARCFLTKSFSKIKWIWWVYYVILSDGNLQNP